MTLQRNFGGFANNQLPATNYRLRLPNTYIPNIAALIDPAINIHFLAGPSDRPTPFDMIGIFASASVDSRFTCANFSASARLLTYP